MDVTVGQTARREVTVTAEMVADYAKLTGDYNPLHFDESFVGKTRFGRLIAQGGIATGLLHALVAMDMPGAGSVFTKQTWNFPRPVYIGDTIRAEATVTSVHPRLPMTDVHFKVTNQDNEEVLTGEATVYQATPDA
jgi:acyl dehydratase